MIETWQDAVIENPGFYVGWFGLLIGGVFGFLIQRSNFCTMGALSDIMNFGDYRRMRSWLLATAVAILGVFLIEGQGVVDMTNSIYLSKNLTWGGHVIGGLLFGIGMVLSGGCVSKNLSRAGGGDMRALMVLIVVGIAAYMTIGGLFAQTRVSVVGVMTTDLSAFGIADQRISSILAAITGASAATMKTATVVVLQHIWRLR